MEEEKTHFKHRLLLKLYIHHATHTHTVQTALNSTRKQHLKYWTLKSRNCKNESCRLAGSVHSQLHGVLAVVLEGVGCHGVQQPTTCHNCSSSGEDCGADNSGAFKYVYMRIISTCSKTRQCLESVFQRLVTDIELQYQNKEKSCIILLHII